MLKIALLAALAFGQEKPEESFEIRNLGTCGLVTRYASSQIKETCLTDATNVYLDEDAGIVRRKGFAKYNATAITGAKSVRGVWPFRATDGTQYQVVLSSQTMYQSSGLGTFTEITGLDSRSATQDMDCTQCLGRFWCVNGAQNLFYWDGTSTATVAGSPTCQAIDCFRNRVVQANCSGTLSQLRASGEGDGTDWTIPSSPASTSPISLSVGGVNDGNRLTGIMGVYQDVLVLGKLESTYGLYGFDRRDFVIREISREVGLVDNRSAREKQGSLYWLSKRGVEKMTGPSIDRVSDPIRDLVDTIIVAGGNSRSATDTSQTDFEAGTLAASGPGAPMSATISPGNVVPSSWTRTDTLAADFAAGTLVTVSTNNSGNLTISQASSGTFVNAGAESNSTSTNIESTNFTAANDGTETLFGSYAWKTPEATTLGNTATFTATDTNDVVLVSTGIVLNSSSRDATIDLATQTVTMVKLTARVLLNSGGSAVSRSVPFIRPQNIKIKSYIAVGDAMYWDTDESSYTLNGNIVSQGFNTALSTPTWGTFTANFSSSTQGTIGFETQSSADGSSWAAAVAASNGSRVTSSQQQYIRYKASFSVHSTTNTPAILEDVTLIARTTGYFISQCRNPGTAITQWGLFQCNQVLNEGTMSFAISTGPACHGVTRSTAVWTSQTNNSVITVATAAFVAYRVLFDVDSGTEAPTINDCTINWNEGTSRPAVAAEVYRDRYYLAYTSGTSGTPVNDNILVLDSRDQWSLHDAPNCASLGIYNRNLYCGDSADSGFVYQADVGQDDGGASFTSRIKTKDFDFGNQFQRKVLSRMYYDLAGLPDPGYSIDLTPSYTLDASTDTVTLSTIGLDEDYSRFIAAKVPADLGNNTTGRWFSFGLTHTGASGPWKLFGLRLVFSRLKED